MPEYTFECRCGEHFELISSIQDYDNLDKRCPKCGGEAERNYLADNILVDDGVPRTLGALADKNSRKLGEEQIRRKLNEQRN